MYRIVIKHGFNLKNKMSLNIIILLYNITYRTYGIVIRV